MGLLRPDQMAKQRAAPEKDGGADEYGRHADMPADKTARNRACDLTHILRRDGQAENGTGGAVGHIVADDGLQIQRIEIDQE